MGLYRRMRSKLKRVGVLVPKVIDGTARLAFSFFLFPFSTYKDKVIDGFGRNWLTTPNYVLVKKDR